MNPILIFATASILIIWVSRRSLLHPSSHGFFRFFGFEAILALVLINFQYWFIQPASLQQLFSWLLLGISLVYVLWGIVLLRRLGGFQKTTATSQQFNWESTQHLVTVGIYRYVRHPLYASLLFLAWGAYVKHTSISTFVLAGIASVALAATAKAEEAENLIRFGEEYQHYMRRTCRFIPFLL